MAAGVPIKKMVAGISCGLVTGEVDEDYVLLTDIQGLEDFFGDMDFKVTGTTEGITAIQMDIKIHGLTRPMVEGAIARCREARLFIMDTCMKKAIAEPRPEVGPYAPKIISIQIDPEKIGDVVGQRGKTINEIIARTGVKILFPIPAVPCLGSSAADLLICPDALSGQLHHRVDISQLHGSVLIILLTFIAPDHPHSAKIVLFLDRLSIGYPVIFIPYGH